MQIKVNGETRDVPPDSTLTELLESLSVKDVRVAVEVNLEVVRREQRAAHVLTDGDSVEIVSFVGGGA